MKGKNIFKFFAVFCLAAALFISSSQTVYAQLVFDAVSGCDVEASETDCLDCFDCSGSGKCRHCDGKGRVSMGYTSFGCTICSRTGGCSVCGGSGEMTEVEYVIQQNIAVTPSGYIQTGSPDDLYACRYCFGTGFCKFCSGDGVNDTTGNACVYCSQDVGVCNNCSGYGCLTRDEHNARLADNAARRYASGDDTEEKCSQCGGSGYSNIPCHTCNGTGKYQGSSVVVRGLNQNKCLSCDGMKYEKCAYCNGKGKM